MNTIIEKIRAEVERLKNDRAFFDDNQQLAYWEGLNKVSEKLSDLEKEEKPMNEIEEIIEQELERYARENWEFNEVLRKEVPFDVEDCKWCDLVAFARHFAQWQKEQLMKEAVEGYVSSTKGDHFGCVTSMPTDLGKLYCPDKVKLIIIKED